ncbi:MAG: hypothetical protein IJ343_16075 [Clostridia bacterium]|nr:hypothetical protein [Clostridia bacterium]
MVDYSTTFFCSTMIVMAKKGGAGVVEDKDREKWAAIEEDYLSGEMSVRDISKKHGVSESRIYKKATSDGWKKKKAKIKQKADEIVITRRARARAREIEVMCSATARMAQLLDKTVAALEEKPSDEVIRSLKGLSALGSAIKANTDALVILHGIQTPAQVEAQRIARARLKLEERKARREEMAADNAGAKQQVELTLRREAEEDDEQIKRIKELCEDPTAEA